jgi:extradiol dioxygenase family protein
MSSATPWGKHMASTARQLRHQPQLQHLPAPFHLSIITHSLDEARRFYADILGCEETGATPTSVHFDLWGSQLTLHEIADYQAASVQCEVGAENVPVPQFGVALDEADFHQIAGRLREANWPFVLEPYQRFMDEEHEQWVLFVLDPSGNAIEITSLYPKQPSGT